MRRYLSLLLLLLLTAAPSMGQRDSDFPPRPNPPKLVNDLAGVLSPDERELLEAKAVAFNDSTSNEVAIVTIHSLGDYDVADYTTRLGNKWGVGKSSKSNGVLILIAVDDHKMNISVGKGLEARLTDLMSGRIIRNEMAPAFRQNNYYAGFDRALDAIAAATRGEYQADEKTRVPAGKVSVIAVIIIVLIILIIIRKTGGGGGGTYMSRRGWGGFGGGFLTGSMFDGPGWGGGGGGGWSGGGSSSGGFGGFGGGSFGGGGASGSW